MKERVHIHTLEVSGQGQIINFQVRIPRDAKRIVGILITENAIATAISPSASPSLIPILPSPETVPGFTYPNPGMIYMPNTLAAPGLPPAAPTLNAAFAVPISRITFPLNVGTILLQSKNKANFFYQEDILHNENSFAQGDFSQSNPITPTATVFASNGALPSAMPNAVVPGGPSTALPFGTPDALAARAVNFKGGANYKEVCMEIDVQNTKLFGMYTDVINELRRTDNAYQVKLYFYYEQKRIISNEN
jgi:hypothetical protein